MGSDDKERGRRIRTRRTFDFIGYIMNISPTQSTPHTHTTLLPAARP